MSDGKKRIGKTAFSTGSAVLVLVIMVLVNISIVPHHTGGGTPPQTICIHCPREHGPSFPNWTRRW
jgi:hypothetical protein